MAKLEARDGQLFLGEHLLICHYPEGDVDTCPWPMQGKHHDRLSGALYDAVEQGWMGPREPTVLPDGTTFLRRKDM